MLQPKLVKYRKPHKVVPSAKKPVDDKLYFGAFGLLALDNSLISAGQIESARKAIVGYVKRKGKLWLRIFPDMPVTKHPAQARMGSGKGDVEYYAAVVRKGRILFELGGITLAEAKEAFRLASNKLSVKVKVITK